MVRLAIVGAIGLAACGRIGFDEELTPTGVDQARNSVAMGVETACAIRNGGEVWCWGVGDFGELGGDPQPPAARPVRVESIPRAVSVSFGRHHGCIAGDNGEVWCWGGNEFGRVGIPAGSGGFVAIRPGGEPTLPTQVPLPEGAVEVSVTSDFSCAVFASGEVWCWGQNDTGQLGRGTISAADATNEPDAVMGVDDAIHISVDDDTACALRRGGQIVCWGENGKGLIDATTAAKLVATPVEGLDGATNLAVGLDHLCAVIDGHLGCRGRNESGELGDGTTNNPPGPVYSTIDDFVAVDASTEHTCGVRANGNAMCWGYNDTSLLGDGTFQRRVMPTPVIGLEDAMFVATYENASCALRNDGDISCWGWGAHGLLGDGRTAVVRATAVPGTGTTTMIATGNVHSCASDGVDVACWGANDHGQLGLGDDGYRFATPQVLPFAWPAQIRQIAAGSELTCAVLVNDTVYCWGRNYDGQLGNGTTDEQRAPVLVASLPPVVSIGVGNWHACARTATDDLYCWGDNGGSQIGDGMMMDRPTPVMVASGVSAFGVGDAHVCTIARSNGQVACWGDNANGEVGDGTQAMRPIATPIAGMLATGISVGGTSTCVERTTGGITCWGLNGFNLFGAPTAAYVQPSPVASVEHTALFAIGGQTACTGTSCWGNNNLGQLGVGDLAIYGGPTPIVGLPSNASTFSISNGHTCALVMGAVYCWGENAHGEIGDGTSTWAQFPTTNVAFP